MLKLVCGFRGDKKLEVNDYWILDPIENKKEDKNHYAIMSDKGILGKFSTYEDAKKTFEDMVCEENLQMNGKHRESKIKYNQLENGKEYIVVLDHKVSRTRVVGFIRNKEDVSDIIGVSSIDGDILFKDKPKFNTTYWRIEEGSRIYKLLDDSAKIFFDEIL